MFPKRSVKCLAADQMCLTTLLDPHLLTILKSRTGSLPYKERKANNRQASQSVNLNQAY